MAKTKRARLELSIEPEVMDQIVEIGRVRGYSAKMGRTVGEVDKTATVVALVNEEHARLGADRTLAAHAREDEKRAREVIASALTLSGGSVARARELAGEAIGRGGPIDHNDWQKTIKILGIKSGKKEQSGA